MSFTNAIRGAFLVGGLTGLSRPDVAHATVRDTTRSASTIDNSGSTTVDTAMLSPGHRDFSRYTDVGLCLTAANQAYNTRRRSLEVKAILDTLQHSIGDTLGLHEAGEVARACGSRFTVANTPTADLHEIFQLGLLSRNDSLVQAAFTRQVEQLETPATRLALYTSTVNTAIMKAHLSIDDPFVRRLFAYIDTHGSAAERLGARAQLLQYWEAQNDVAAIQREAWGIIQTARQLPDAAFAPDSSTTGTPKQPVYQAYRDLLKIAFFRSPDSVLAIGQQAKQDLGWYKEYQTGRAGHWEVAPWSRDFRSLPVQNVIDSLLPVRAQWETARPFVAPLQAEFWFPDRTGRVQPVRGNVTLFVGGGGSTRAAQIRRLLAQYGTRGLNVVIVQPTRGFMSSPEVNYSLNYGPWDPAEEARQIRWYYQEYEQLPVTVAVQEQHFRTLPPPDYRRVRTDVAEYERNGEGGCGANNGDGCVVVVGRDGTRLYAGNLRNRPQNWADDIFTDVLAWAVAQK